MYRRILLVTVIVALSAFRVDAALIVNEVLYDSTTGDGVTGANGEWIELYNSGPSSVDASNFIVTDGDWSIVINSGITISSGQFYLIGFASTAADLGGTPTFDIDLDTYTNTAGATPMTLTNTGEFVGLFNASGTLLDGIVWENPSTNNTPGSGTSASVALPAGHPLGTTLTIPSLGYSTITGNAGNGESIARNIDGGGTWVFSSTLANGNTAGAMNATPEPASIACLLCGLPLLVLTRRRRADRSTSDET